RSWAVDAKSDEPPPVFLLGFPRSGTTMTEQIIATHPDLTTLDEKPALQSVMQRMYAQFESESSIGDMLRGLSDAQRNELAALYRRRAHEFLPKNEDAPIIVDKFPLNIMALPFIARTLPDAKAIIAIRDPRDVVLSCFMQEFALNSSMINFLDLRAAADFYSKVMRLWLDWRDALPVETLTIRYRDTVTDLESQTRRLFEFLGVEWRAETLRFHEQQHRRFVSTPSYEAISTPVHTRAIGRWRNYERHLEPILETLAPFVTAFGCE
ncbi:MAG: sulfotransferase, partial [Planctomycetota bacterium]|nr:sulfotransferase [Planctomycetota bacterium]